MIEYTDTGAVMNTRYYYYLFVCACKLWLQYHSVKPSDLHPTCWETCHDIIIKHAYAIWMDASMSEFGLTLFQWHLTPMRAWEEIWATWIQYVYLCCETHTWLPKLETQSGRIGIRTHYHTLLSHQWDLTLYFGAWDDLNAPTRCIHDKITYQIWWNAAL